MRGAGAATGTTRPTLAGSIPAASTMGKGKPTNVQTILESVYPKTDLSMASVVRVRLAGDWVKQFGSWLRACGCSCDELALLFRAASQQWEKHDQEERKRKRRGTNGKRVNG